VNVTATRYISKPEELEGALRQGLDTIQAGQPYPLEVLTDPSLPKPTKVPEPRLDILFAAVEPGGSLQS
jgi:hypothetical protein